MEPLNIGSMRNKSAGHRNLLKTIDVGNDGTSVSADRKGSILGLTTFHPKHGIVVAEPYQQFPGDKFHDSNYVRRHRTRMLESLAANDSPGYGICVNRPVPSTAIVEYDSFNRASIRQSFNDGIKVDLTLLVTKDGLLVQHCKVSNTTDATVSVPWTFVANISVNRASYGQLTEGGPIPLPPSENEVKILADQKSIAVINRPLGAHIVFAVEVDGKIIVPRDMTPCEISCAEPIKGSAEGVISIPAQNSKTLLASFRLRPGATPEGLPSPSPSTMKPAPKFWRGAENAAQYIVRRNLDYILGCCSVSIPASEEVVCIITDHVALPLGWNRDNYWQTRFLMDAWRGLRAITSCTDTASYAARIKYVLKGHLTWVYQYAQRPHGYWHRSYLTTGKPKDGPVFQLDQQCYPLLELADFSDLFPEQIDFVRVLLERDVIGDIVAVIASKMDQSTGLVATEETPGDDPVEFEFHFSSHVLVWYTLKRLGALMRRADFKKTLLQSQIDRLTASVRRATVTHFLKPHPKTGEPLFVYLADGHGRFRVYHDANDIPTLFAQEWGLLESEDEVTAWRNTLRFANTQANVGGYYEGGPYDGLGSVHSPAPWPLGFYQTWLFSQMVGDSTEEAESWKKIIGVMQPDGTFCEAIDAGTGKCISKAWFCWPGAMIGSGLLRDDNRTKYLESE